MAQVSAPLLLLSEAVNLFIGVGSSGLKEPIANQGLCGTLVLHGVFGGQPPALDSEGDTIRVLTTNRDLNNSTSGIFKTFFEKFLLSSFTATRAWWAGPGLGERGDTAGPEQRRRRQE